MKKKEKQRIISFVKKAQVALRLQDWTIEVNLKDAAEDSAYATMETFGESRHAELKISKKFFKLPVKIQRQTLIHELIHCHLFFIEGALVHTLHEALSSSKADIVSRVLTTEIERSTDSLADVITNLYKAKY